MRFPLNLFYEEPDPDRWIPLDRYPRRVVRRVIRGKAQPGGHQRVFLNLCAGLDRLGVPYRVNDFRHTRRHPSEVACIIGKPHLLDRCRWDNPILLGAAIFAHPIEDPGLLERRSVRRVLVASAWVRAMFAPSYGDDVVHAWPVGIDTDHWMPTPEREKDIDVLVYDKVMWKRAHLESAFIAPVHDALQRRRLRIATVRYGKYREADFQSLVARSHAMIFLCEHESQGIAYQQALACDVPVLAWDKGGDWPDPSYYPHRVQFGPVTSVPYWDDRCGRRFSGLSDFEAALDDFWRGVKAHRFAPREYIEQHLTLEQSAQRYLSHVEAVEHGSRTTLAGATCR